MAVHLRHRPSPCTLSGQSVYGPKNIPSSSRIGPSSETLVLLGRAWLPRGLLPRHESSSGWCFLGRALVTVDKFSTSGQHPSGLQNWIIAWKLLHVASSHQGCLTQASVWITLTLETVSAFWVLGHKYQTTFLRSSLAMDSSAHNIWHLRPPDPQGHAVVTMYCSPLAFLIFRF